MKAYELSILIHPDLEMNLDPVFDKVKKLIESNGGKITGEENDGKRRTAYTIKGQDYAIFYYVDVELPPEAPGKIESTLNITDEVIRHMLVTADSRVARHRSHEAEGEASANKEGKEV